MAFTVDQLPRDMLWVIAQQVWDGRRRGRWGVYAVFRLVCKRFRQGIPLSVLYAAWKDDFYELFLDCLPSFERIRTLVRKAFVRVLMFMAL